MLFKELIKSVSKNPFLKPEVFKNFVGINPFVISNDFAQRVEKVKFEPVAANTIIATPFELFSVECSEGKDLFELNECPLDAYQGRAIKRLIIYCFICVEKSPGRYEFITDAAMIDEDGNIQKSTMVVADRFYSGKNPGVLYSSLANYVEFFTKEIGSNAAMEKMPGSEVVKTRIRGNKVINKIKNVIFVKSKSEPRGTSANTNQELSHRFWVRGHWRKVSGIGKNRGGDYVVNGFTFIKEFIKGDGNKPLIIKTRVINQPNLTTHN